MSIRGFSSFWESLYVGDVRPLRCRAMVSSLADPARCHAVIYARIA